MEARIADLEREVRELKARPIVPPSPAPEDLITLKAAAELLDCSVKTLYRRIDAGELKIADRRGRAIFVRRGDL
jgi:hypothetical protein